MVMDAFLFAGRSVGRKLMGSYGSRVMLVSVDGYLAVEGCGG